MAWFRSHYERATAPEAPGPGGAHEPVVIPRRLQTRHHDEPALQYQKLFRLKEARRRRMTGAVDGATAGHRVGHQSASRFSRVYRRAFGTSPGPTIVITVGKIRCDALGPIRARRTRRAYDTQGVGSAAVMRER
jgi:AraC-like DNA-binding protein